MCLFRWQTGRQRDERSTSGTKRSRRIYRAVPVKDGRGRFEFQPLGEDISAEPGAKEPSPLGAAVPAYLGLSDEVNLLAGDIAIRLSRDLRSTLPHEVTIVIPRVDIRRKFQDGKLVETEVEYAGITLSHSPRFPPKSL